MTGTQWLSVHAFHHGDQDRLLTTAVGPLIEELAATGLARGCFFLRYWDGGSHIRFRALAEQGTSTMALDLIGQRFEEYFRAHPSAGTTSPEQYSRLARELARFEGLTTHSPSLYPNDSVVVLPYQPEHDRYGHGPSLAAVERHFIESSRIALRLLDRTTFGERTRAACAIILLTWFIGEPDPARLVAWHGGARRALEGMPGWVPDGLATAFEQRRDGLARLSGQMRTLARSARQLPGSGVFAEWARCVVELRDALITEIKAEAFRPAYGAWGGPEAPTAGEHQRSPLPTLDICAHLLCNRIGVGPAVEGNLRDLAARAVAGLAADQEYQ